jgi:hypothetical protein
MNEQATAYSAKCDACGADTGPLMKLSMGRDFFGRAYDRLSPSADQSPKWYCETCSMHKNLQRDFRDIKAEFDKLSAGQSSDLSSRDQLQRAQLRLREISTILGQSGSKLLSSSDVDTLLGRLQTQATAAAG